jgi:fructose-1,6-bisphosphatase/inositol monophosphatase family enzyme
MEMVIKINEKMNHEKVKDLLIETGQLVFRKVWQQLQESNLEMLSAVHKEAEDDTIYAIDRHVEEVLVEYMAGFAADLGGIVLMAEGVGDVHQGVVLPSGIQAKNAAIKIIIDPIDGTRGIMYNKRSAFFLAGAAPNKGADNTLADIEVAVMVELPTSKAHFSDTLWAIKGQGAHGFSLDIYSGSRKPILIQPSKAKTIMGGFGQIARFFPPGRSILAAIEDEMIDALVPSAPAGKTLVFEDQYISSGGQMYEILMGHDRYVADIRDLLNKKLMAEGRPKGHICHPYDVCVFLIGQEAGLIITDSKGKPFNCKMDLISDIGWIAYANAHIQQEVEPILLKLMHKHNLL